MANRVMGYMICGYNSVDNLLSEQSSPFRRWTTSGGAGSSYRHHNLYNKQMSEGAAPPAGGVARWSLGLEQLLADPAGAAAFQHFLNKEFAVENLRFWYACEQYKTCEDDEKRAQLAEDIWDRHLAEGSNEAVNLDAGARRAAELRRRLQRPPHDLFLQAQKQIFNVMKFDSYPRFLRSAEHAECARAELRGLPSPYLPPSAPSSLKKSASNASERRRSGASLLPWRRAASRDRALQQNVDEVLADVVKSQCTLCRVVLPDGSTSVVGVDEAVTVQQLVDRQLHRRNLNYKAYDVMVKKDPQSVAEAVDLSSSSSTLGGRAAVVEERCLVHVVVRGRCVAVRCRPERHLRRVLGQVLQRYAARDTQRHSVNVLRDGVPLSLKTTMQELNAATLVIVEVPEVRSNSLDRDSDSQSDEEGTLRLQEESKDNGSGSSGHSGNSGNSGVSGNSGHSLNSGSSRVRAMLRPGAAVHSHPPDFLENLREKQRLRLQQTGVSPPAPRSPPPLPPKPAPRATPTLV